MLKIAAKVTAIVGATMFWGAIIIPTTAIIVEAVRTITGFGDIWNRYISGWHKYPYLTMGWHGLFLLLLSFAFCLIAIVKEMKKEAWEKQEAEQEKETK